MMRRDRTGEVTDVLGFKKQKAVGPDARNDSGNGSEN